MEGRTPGKSGLKVSELEFGSWPAGGLNNEYIRITRLLSDLRLETKI